MTMACRYMEIQRNTGSPFGAGRSPTTDARARSYGNTMLISTSRIVTTT